MEYNFHKKDIKRIQERKDEYLIREDAFERNYMVVDKDGKIRGNDNAV